VSNESLSTNGKVANINTAIMAPEISPNVRTIFFICFVLLSGFENRA
jgi:hypothetical protein